MPAARPESEPERQRGASSSHRALRLLAEEAARTGGQVARGYFRSELTVRLKDDRSEVSDADDAAQAAVVACIRAMRPRDAFIAEETLPLLAEQTPPTNDAFCWVIDPIDGTRNFVRGIPVYVCSVAVMRGGTPLAGALYDPERDTLYSASRDEGLFVNGRPHPPELDAAARARRVHPRPVVAIPSSPVGPMAARAHAWLDRYICRNLGTTALHLGLVATGELDGALADNCRLWDIAAGWVLLTAAGRVMTDPAGAPLFPLDVGRYHGEELPAIAASADFHAQLLGAGA